jgi:hypothetical protein
MDFAGITAVYGRPGAGKTVFAARMAHKRLSAGERVLWATFYEDRQTLVGAMARLGYDLSGAEVWEVVLTDPTSTFNQLSHIVSHSLPNLLVLDSITQLQVIDVRANVTNLIYRAFKFAGIDAVIVSEEPVGALGHIADNLVRLSLEITPRGRRGEGPTLGGSAKALKLLKTYYEEGPRGPAERLDRRGRVRRLGPIRRLFVGARRRGAQRGGGLGCWNSVGDILHPLGQEGRALSRV